MTFDMRKAREICGRIKGYEDPDGGNCGDFEAADMFPAALDEIDRLIHSVDEAVIQLGACRLVAKQIQNEQAKRIAELEGDLSDYKKVARDLDRDLVKKAMLADKQRAALKKLGQAKRARGKALVEERAGNIKMPCRYDGPLTRCNYSDNDSGWCLDCGQKERIRKLARDQLRQEGLI